MATGLPRGSLAAVLTPLTDRGEIHEPDLRTEIEAIVSGGVAGIVVLGSSGEVASLSKASREAVVRTARGAVPADFPVIVGVAATGLAAALDDLSAAIDGGATAALVAPPFYGPVDQASVRRFYEAMAAASSIPMLGYHIPAFTGVRLEPATVAGLAADGVLIGLKDSNRDLEYLQQIVAIGDSAASGWTTYVGTDSLILPAMVIGATGGITLAASIVPSWTARLVALIEAGDLAAARGLQATLTELILVLRRGSFPAGAKAALSILGISSPELVPPARGLDDEQIASLRVELERLGVTAADKTERTE